jgi:hypothetical protein
MKGRKRASILATMVATGLIGIAALGASSASADVLCKDIAFNYDCSTEKTWGVGTEFEALSGAVVMTPGASGGWPAMATCAGSNLEWKVTNAGGYYETAYPEVDATSMKIFGCVEDSISVINDGGGKITQLSYGSASQQGLFYPSGLEVKTISNWLNGKYEECTYKIVGSGTIEGAKTTGSSETKLIFKEALAEKLTGTGTGCFPKARFTAKYSFGFESGEGIYVVPQ